MPAAVFFSQEKSVSKMAQLIIIGITQNLGNVFVGKTWQKVSTNYPFLMPICQEELTALALTKKAHVAVRNFSSCHAMQKLWDYTLK